MRLSITTLILSFFLATVITAQDYNFYTTLSKKYKVIAVSGLNLRAKPNVQSAILKKIPYCDQVNLFHRDDYGYEILDTMETDSGSKYVASGFWIKVKHGNDEGYLNTAYLYPIYDEYFMDEDLEKEANKDYVILMPGLGCNDNIIDNYHQLHWYGMYNTENGNTLQSVAFQYFRTDGDMVDLTIATKNDKGLKYIIGTRIPMIEGEVTSGIEDYNLYKSGEITDTIERVSYEDEFCVVKTKATLYERNNNGEIINEYYPTYSLFAKADDKVQWINDGSYIDFVGDIDRDGKMDYIVTRGEKSAMTILYLSSERKAGEIVRPVGIFYSGYCC